MKTIEDLVREVKGDGKASGKSTDELALGHLRYEAIRKVSPRYFTELHKRNINGENFDQMVDVLVVKFGNPFHL